MSKLEFISGEGYEHYHQSNSTGLFEVRASITRKFTQLDEAVSYYHDLMEDKALWDLSGVAAKLLESHRLVFGD